MLLIWKLGNYSSSAAHTHPPSTQPCWPRQCYWYGNLGNYGNSAAPPTHPHPPPTTADPDSATDTQIRQLWQQCCSTYPPPPTTTDPENVADDPMGLGHIAPHDFVAQWNKLHRYSDANMFPAHFAWMAQKQREWIETAPGWCCACVRIKWTETLMVFDNKINSHLSLQGMWNRSDSPGHNLKNKQRESSCHLWLSWPGHCGLHVGPLSLSFLTLSNHGSAAVWKSRWTSWAPRP